MKEKLDPGRHDISKKKRYLMMLTKICKVYCFVPASHLVLDSELEKLGDKPFKSEEDSNVWPGTYKEQEVSIKAFISKTVRLLWCCGAVPAKKIT